jgi:hypothetical protein
MFLPQCEQPSFTPYKTTVRIIVASVLMFIFLDSKTKAYAPNESRHSQTSISSYFPPEWNFDSLGLFPNI